MNIKRVKDLLYMAIAELEKLEARPAPVKIPPVNKAKRKEEMRIYNAYIKGIIDKEDLERELKRLNQDEPPTIY